MRRFLKNIKQSLLGKKVPAPSKRMRGKIAYSQEGEDMLLRRIFSEISTGFYVDVGAHHPIRFSNTYAFYLKGWRGINIDAMPGAMKLFDQLRPEDINIEQAVSDTEEILEFYIFNEPALNTFSSTEVKRKDGLRDYKVLETKKIVTKTLNQILEEHVEEHQHIDFISIDVEGLDLKVLRSLDLTKFRPTCILVEELEQYTISELIEKSEMYKYLVKHNYSLIAKTVNTLFFKTN